MAWSSRDARMRESDDDLRAEALSRLEEGRLMSDGQSVRACSRHHPGGDHGP